MSSACFKDPQRSSTRREAIFEKLWTLFKQTCFSPCFYVVINNRRSDKMSARRSRCSFLATLITLDNLQAQNFVEMKPTFLEMEVNLQSHRNILVETAASERGN